MLTSEPQVPTLGRPCAAGTQGATRDGHDGRGAEDEEGTGDLDDEGGVVFSRDARGGGEAGRSARFSGRWLADAKRDQQLEDGVEDLGTVLTLLRVVIILQLEPLLGSLIQESVCDANVEICSNFF